MRHSTGVVSSKDDRVASDGRVVCQVVLSVCAYSVVFGALAVGLGQLAADVTGTALPAAWVRLGAAGAVVVAAGLNTERVARCVGSRLGLHPSSDDAKTLRGRISK